MKTTLFILLLTFPAFAQIDVKYDKFKDYTVLTSQPNRIGYLQLTVKAMHQGEKPADLKYYLLFRSSSRTWQFLRGRGLIFLADGERIDLGEGSHDGNVSRHSSGVVELMMYPLTRTELEKLANASSLEMKLGYVEKKLDGDDRKGMKEMLAHSLK
jgi:hypothetical protein